jgi:predicted PurR-regulated permease PerM
MHPLDRFRETRLLPVIVGLAIITMGLFLLRVAHILPPFIWAAVTAYLFYPLVVRIERALRVPRGIIIGAIYVVFISLLIFVSVQVIPTLYEQSRSLVISLPSLVNTARQELLSEPQIGIGGFVINTQELIAETTELAQQLATRFGQEAVPLVLHTVEFLIRLLVYLLVTFYLLLQGNVLVNHLQQIAPPRHRATVARITQQVNGTFGSYIRAQLILFLIVSFATFIALRILEVQYALVLAITTGALELIPIIGPWVAAGSAILVALSQGTTPFNWSPVQLATVVGITYFVLRMIQDHLIIPQLIGRVVRLHPVVVIFGLLAGSSIAGVLGLLLAVPTLAVIKIIVLAILEELRHPPVRNVVPLRNPEAFQEFVAGFSEYHRQSVVLLVAEDVITWDHLDAIQRLAAEAVRQDTRIQVVTPDPVAASVATAAGIEVVTRGQRNDEAAALAGEHDEHDREPAEEPRLTRLPAVEVERQTREEHAD